LGRKVSNSECGEEEMMEHANLWARMVDWVWKTFCYKPQALEDIGGM
jgi:hypothetical protein